jgi:hypothetical protein
MTSKLGNEVYRFPQNLKIRNAKSTRRGKSGATTVSKTALIIMTKHLQHLIQYLVLYQYLSGACTIKHIRIRNLRTP